MQYWGRWRWLHLCNLCKPGIRLRQQSPPDPEHHNHVYPIIISITRWAKLNISPFIVPWYIWCWHFVWLIMRHHLSPELSQRSYTFDTISMNMKIIVIPPWKTLAIPATLNWDNIRNCDVRAVLLFCLVYEAGRLGGSLK